jgi:hypothetical protein
MSPIKIYKIIILLCTCVKLGLSCELRGQEKISSRKEEVTQGRRAPQFYSSLNVITANKARSMKCAEQVVNIQ